MGLNLHYTILTFFEKKMDQHSMVDSFQRTDNNDEYVYASGRIKYADTIRVWLSDAYIFSEQDFVNRPREIRTGDYILIARPESMGWIDTTGDKIGIGKIGEFMGALNVPKVWTYKPPTDEERSIKKSPNFFRKFYRS
jgi:hypothetical protein